MARKEGRRLGRNDRCHCGSGEKYKHCCLEADRAAGHTPPPPGVARPGLAEALQRETRYWPEGLVHEVLDLSERGGPELDEVRDHLRVLLEQGGPLQHLRFDPAGFDRVIRALDADRLEALDRRNHTRALAGACLPELHTVALQDRVVREASKLVSTGTLDPDDALAAGYATLSCLALAPELGAEIPPIFSIFSVQLEEGLDAATRQVIGALEEEEDLQGVRWTHPGVAERLAEVPAYQWILRVRVEQAVALAEELVERDELPPLLTVAETLRIVALFERLAAGAGPDAPPLRGGGVAGELSAVVLAVLYRLETISSHPRLPEVLREQYGSLAVAVSLNPYRYLVEILVEDRSQPMVQEAEYLEALRRYLDSGHADEEALEDLRRIATDLDDELASDLLDRAHADFRFAREAASEE